MSSKSRRRCCSSGLAVSVRQWVAGQRRLGMDVRKIVCVGAAGFIGSLLITAAAVPAHSRPPLIVQAQPPDPEALTASVSFYIADLRSERGQKDLVRRVHTATHQVCPEDFAISPLNAYQRSCLETAWNGARPQIEAAIDTAMNSKLAGAVPMTVSIGIVGSH